MKTLKFEGCWPETLAGWNGELAEVVDVSGKYSRHSHFVQALKRELGEGFLVWSRKKTCLAVTLMTD